MTALKKIRNYCLYCGIEKDEYNAIKKDAYVSNFQVWRMLHFLMLAVFGLLYVNSLFSELLETNRLFYLIGLLYSAAAVGFFFVLKKDSLAAQLLIYCSISFLFLFGCFITQNKPEMPATMFIVLLLITPMFMIDKPYFMALELIAASTVFLIWMRGVKPHEIWTYDLVNVVIYTLIGIFLHIIANSIRIKEFALTRKINIQKDTDELTGLMNKAALTREINGFLTDDETEKGTMYLLDVDRFKAINDSYGHDVGDSVIMQLGSFLGDRFSDDREIAGRFGGDEFIVFVKDTNDPEVARKTAEDIIAGVSGSVALPDRGQRVDVSVGIALYVGHAKNYSELFKKADTALYKAKADPVNRYCIYE